MSDNADSSLLGRRRRERRPSLAPREVVLGLDRLEWGVSLFGAGIALVLALVTGIEWARNEPVITTQKFVKGKACPSDFAKHVGQFCEHVTTETKSYWEIHFFFILLIGLCILYFTLRRKRAGVACFSIFLGLALGLGSGLVFFFLGAWLIVRAYRLQKYGESAFFASNRVAREQGEARRRERKENGGRPKRGAPETAKVLTPEASKRYTPKKQQRRR